MPQRRLDLRLPPEVADPVEDLARIVLSMEPEHLRGWSQHLDPQDLAMVEQILADRAAAGWRVDPATMAAFLDPSFEAWAYMRLLAGKFVDGIEGRAPRQIWSLPSRMGKPVEVNELVLMADGSRRRLGDIEVGDLVITHLGRPRRVVAVHEQGTIPVVEIVTNHGRHILAAPDHPFLTADGWREAGQLRAGSSGLCDTLASISEPEWAWHTDRKAEEFRLAGYFVGDGSVTYSAGGGLNAAVTCFDPVEGDDIIGCAEAMGWRVNTSTRGRYSFRAGEGRGRDGSGPRPWLITAEIAGHGAHTKRVPSWVFTASPEMIGEFVGAYLACDGSVSTKPLIVEFYSMSRGLLADVQHLLLRLGVPARLAVKHAESTNFTDGPVDSWRLTITGADSIARFKRWVHPRSVKAAILDQMPVVRQSFDVPYLPDQVRVVADAGVAQCRCLTVEEDATFVVGDVVVHNTTLIRWCIAFGLDREPRSRWIYTTYGDGLASETGDAVRQILRTHADALRAQLRQDMARRDRFMTPEGGGLLCRGFGSGIIGFGAGVPGLAAAGGGMFVDDPMKNWQEAHSPTKRKKVADHFFGVLRHRIDEETVPVFVVHARWHEEDLSGELQRRAEDETGEPWEIIKIPSLAVEDDPADDALGRSKGEPIEPARFTREAVLSRHLGMADTYIVQAIEQQQPLPDQGIELLREWFILAETAEQPRRADEAITSWDLKLKNREAGDYVVGQVWWRVGSVYWLMDTIRGKYDHATTENAVALLAVRHPEATRHIIEAAGSADEVIPELRKPIDGYVVSPEMQARLGMSDVEVGQVEALRRSGIAHITPNAAVMSKEVRARTYIAPAAERGDVRMPADGPWVAALLSELAAFGAPGDHHDDQVDAMSQAIQKLRKGGVVVKAPSRTARRPATHAGIQRTIGPRGG